MPQPPELLAPAREWRLDFRLVDELPEDSVVGRRFLANTLAGLFAAASVLACAWALYHLYATLDGINDWERRITESETEVRRVESLQRVYAVEAGRIDEIHRLMHNPIALTVFLAEFGRTLPPQMAVDMIETRDGAYVVRGTLQEDSERASRLIGAYVSSLTANPIIGPNFKEIKLSGLERFDDQAGLSFELTLTPN